MGLEPTTSCVTGKRSTLLNYTPKYLTVIGFLFVTNAIPICY